MASLFCPECQQRIKVKSDSVGSLIECPRCRANIRVLRESNDQTPFPQNATSPVVWMAIGGGTITVVLLVLALVMDFGKPALQIVDSHSTQPVETVPKGTGEEPQDPVAPDEPDPVPLDQKPIEEHPLPIDKKPVDKQTKTIAEIIAMVEPSVVTIYVTLNGAQATGTGFVVDDQGSIVTNYHVIEGAKSATVMLSNGEKLEVLGFVGVLPGSDLAVIRIASTNQPLKPLPLSTVSPAKGDATLTLGASERLRGSVSTGVVSAVRNGQEISEAFGEEIYKSFLGYDEKTIWVQTTSPISSGNSGGPLLNDSGEVLGINTFSQTLGQNINFAVSASHINQIVDTWDGVVRPLSELPPVRVPPQLAAEKERDERIKELARQRQMERERLENEARAAEQRLRKEIETQNDLNRLTALIAAVRQEITEIEKEGTALTARLGNVTANGAGVFQAGKRIAVKIAELEGHIASINSAINVQSQFAPPPGGSNANLNALIIQRDTLTLEYNSLRQQATQLEAAYVASDQEARSLKAQIEYKTNQRDRKQKDLQRLEVRYQQLTIPAPAKNGAQP